MTNRGAFLWKLDDRGVSTMEFALVLPAFFMMMIGGMHLSMMGFTAASLHHAVEEAARCGAIQTTRCTSTADAQTRASSRFMNITGNVASFTRDTTSTSCYKMNGQVVYPLRAGVWNKDVTLTATACYPV
jgi:Flp pilus assembly protein TadG